MHTKEQVEELKVIVAESDDPYLLDEAKRRLAEIELDARLAPALEKDAETELQERLARENEERLARNLANRVDPSKVITDAPVIGEGGRRTRQITRGPQA